MALITHTFTGKRPSKAKVITIAAELYLAGFSSFELVWGEYWLEFQAANGTLHGHGWLKVIDGSEVAAIINKIK